MTQISNPDFESKHARGAGGKFASKPEGADPGQIADVHDSFDDEMQQANKVVENLLDRYDVKDYRGPNIPSPYDQQAVDDLGKVWPNATRNQRSAFLKHATAAVFFDEGGVDFMMDADEDRKDLIVVDEPDNDMPGGLSYDEPQSGWMQWADDNAAEHRQMAEEAAHECEMNTNVRERLSYGHKTAAMEHHFENTQTRRGDAEDAPYETLITRTFVRAVDGDGNYIKQAAEAPHHFEVATAVTQIDHAYPEDVDNPVRSYEGLVVHDGQFTDLYDAMDHAQSIGTYPDFDSMRTF